MYLASLCILFWTRSSIYTDWRVWVKFQRGLYCNGICSLKLKVSRTTNYYYYDCYYYLYYYLLALPLYYLCYFYYDYNHSASPPCVSRVYSVSTVPSSLTGVCFLLCSEADAHAAHVQRIEMWRWDADVITPFTRWGFEGWMFEGSLGGGGSRHLHRSCEWSVVFPSGFIPCLYLTQNTQSVLFVHSHNVR